MFDTLFHYPRVLARHRDGPASEERQRFLVYRANTGAAPATLLLLARELLVVAQLIDLSGSKLVAHEQISYAAAHWTRYQQQRGRIRTAKFSRLRFVQTATSWLKFLGRLEQQPVLEPLQYAELTLKFQRYMRDERGLSQRTIDQYCWYAHAFLQWLENQGASLAEARLEQVDDFLAWKCARGWCRVSVATGVNALRSFFRYAAEQECCTAVLASGIAGPRLFSQEKLPAGPNWNDVRRLIAATSGTDLAQDIRDHAILLMLAVYGLRSGEVLSLRLNDVDWERDILHVTRSKQRCQQDYPLIATVGNAILRYLQQVRPRCQSRSLFISLRAPFRSLGASGLYHLVRARMRSLDIRSSRHGPHSLRHACATHLVAEGLSLKQIGDHLGHRSAYATRTYAKVDLAGLRQVADVDLGGLL